MARTWVAAALVLAVWAAALPSALSSERASEEWGVHYRDGLVDELVPDGVGGAYVTGRVEFDGYLARYDSDGSELWSVSLGGGASGTSIGLSPDGGTVYVATSDTTISRYSADGTFLSAVVADTMEDVRHLSVAPDGSLFAAGAATAKRAFISRFDAAGDEAWTLEFDLHGEFDTIAAGIAALTSGSVVAVFDVVSASQGFTRITQGRVIDPSGATIASNDALWSEGFGAPFGTSYSTNGVVAVPGDGFVMFGEVTERVSHNRSPEGVVSSWDDDYRLRWVREIGEPTAEEAVVGVDHDAAGNLFVLSTRRPWPYDFSSEAKLTVLSASGTPRWSGSVTGQHHEAGSSIVVDANGLLLTTTYDDITFGESSVLRSFGGSHLRSVDLDAIWATTTDCVRESPHPFTDLGPAGGRTALDVACIYALGVATGTSPTTFAPANVVTRAQMAAFLARMYEALTGMECPAVIRAEPFELINGVVGLPFADVDEGSFAYRPVGCIFGHGITTGTSPTTYEPDAPVTREQMAAFLARLYRLVSADPCTVGRTPFGDVAPTSFAFSDVGCIYALGITTGTSGMTYSPDDFVTRSQMASFLARLFRLLV